MSAFAALLLLLSAPQGTAPELLVFSSPSCGPCIEMAPVVDQLSRMGYPIRKIDISKSPQWADHFNVNVVPTYIAVNGNEVVARYSGKTSFAHLKQMADATGFNANNNRPAVANNNPNAQYDAARSNTQAQNQRGYDAQVANQNVAQRGSETQSVSAMNVSAPQRPAAQFQQTRARELVQQSPDSPVNESFTRASEQLLDPARRVAMAATVRIRVTDQQGMGVGTGTIVHQHGEDALILTCAHLFEGSNGDVSIEVEYGFGGSRDKVPGTLLKYEYDSHDVGLVTFKPRQPVAVAQVALPNYRPISEDALFSIGCDQGADPTFRQTSLADLTTYGTDVLVEKYDTTGRPAVGRSGGGLFTAGGQLIGVCNFAAQDVDEGTYAGMQSIHFILRSVGLRDYFDDPNRLQQQLGLPAQMLAQSDQLNRASAPTTTPSVDARVASDSRMNEVQSQGTPASIIILVPSPGDPSQLVPKTIENPAPDLLVALARAGIQIQSAEQNSGTGIHQIADLRGQTMPQRTPDSNRDWNQIQAPQDDGPQYRAQSQY